MAWGTQTVTVMLFFEAIQEVLVAPDMYVSIVNGRQHQITSQGAAQIVVCIFLAEKRHDIDEAADPTRVRYGEV